MDKFFVYGGLCIRKESQKWAEIEISRETIQFRQIGSHIEGGTQGNSKTSNFLCFVKFGCIYGGFENFGIWPFSAFFENSSFSHHFQDLTPLNQKKVSFYDMCMERGL